MSSGQVVYALTAGSLAARTDVDGLRAEDVVLGPGLNKAISGCLVQPGERTSCLAVAPSAGARHATFRRTDYFEVTLVPTGGRLTVTGLHLLDRRGHTSKPRGWSLATSLDGFASEVHWHEAGTVRPTWGPVSVTLEDTFAGLTEPLTLRFYVWAPSRTNTVEFISLSIGVQVETARADALVSRRLLTWAPPVLVDPVDVEITESAADIKLDVTKDFRLHLPADRPLERELRVWGGHHVELIGGEIDLPARGRALYLQSCTGTTHVEGVKLTGDLSEGINLYNKSGGRVRLQNVQVTRVDGTFATNHADVLQTWAGPEHLEIDGLLGDTTYQGFFLDPLSYGAVELGTWVIRNVHLRDVESRSAYLLWLKALVETTHENIFLEPNPKRLGWTGAWPGQVVMGKVLTDVTLGPPPEPVLCGRPGVGYTTPGYLGA